MSIIRLREPAEKTKDVERIVQKTYTQIRTEILSCKTYEELEEYLLIQVHLNPCLDIIKVKEENEYLDATDLEDEPSEAITDELELSEEYHFEEEPNFEDRYAQEEVYYDEPLILDEDVVPAKEKILFSLNEQKHIATFIADVSSFRGTNKQIKEIFKTSEKYIYISGFPSFYLIYTPNSSFPYLSFKAKAIKQEYDLYLPRLYFYLAHLLVFQKEFFRTSNIIEGYKKMKTLPQRKFLEEIKETYGIPQQYSLDISQLSRTFKDKYLKTHFGLIPLSHFFPTSRGKSTLNEVQILGYILEFIQKDPAITDTQIVNKLKEYNVSRSDICKKREEILCLPSSRNKGIREKIFKEFKDE